MTYLSGSREVASCTALRSVQAPVNVLTNELKRYHEISLQVIPLHAEATHDHTTCVAVYLLNHGVAPLH